MQTHTQIPQSVRLNSAEAPMLPLIKLQSMCILYCSSASLWAALSTCTDVGVQKSENVLLSTTVAMVVIMDTRLIAW